VTIRSLPNLAETASEVAADPQVCGGWLYAPRTRFYDIATSGLRELPHPERVFGLPRSHVITLPDEHASERADFLVWCLGFLRGVHLTTTEAGYLDAAALRPHGFHDINVGGADLANAMHHADRFWLRHRGLPLVTERIKAAINCAWIAALPHRLAYEKFLHVYSALEACYRVLDDTLDAEARKQLAAPKGHAARLRFLCDALGIPRPSLDWTATPHAPKLRNDTLHDGLFLGKPWGYATFGEADPHMRSVVLQMHAVVRRAVVALLGMKDTDYVRSPINTRSRFGLRVPAPAEEGTP
jgi:hypothetical protein